MRRWQIVALILGAAVSAIVIALHASGVTLPLEEMAMSIFPGRGEATRVVNVKVQYALVLFLAFGAVWLALASARRRRIGWIFAVFAVELLIIAWASLLYHVFFQPLPAVLAVGLGFVAAKGYGKFGGRSRSGLLRELFDGRLSAAQIATVAAKGPFSREPSNHDVTTVVCDLANKHDLHEESTPAEIGAITEKFIGHVMESFLEAGAYIESAGGEGIVAIFGFPNLEPEQAVKATRHALSLLESFAKYRDGEKDEAFTKCDIHLGISSGTLVVVPLQKDARAHLLTMGEPVELARRFCIANRFYGSRVLIGPRTFELARETIVARPIDFLSGVDVRERHEIYEPLMLAAEATPDELARRDCFWNGVVLYREKRWAEAYSQFQKARGPDEQADAPLQLYLRRIEPLALHLAMAGDD